ncbi:MAG: amidase [Actinobacteria bacterium]|nr:amidase [Actinomycetota bacterium]
MITTRRLSAAEVVQASLDAIDRHNPDLNVVVARNDEAALTAAGELDRRVAAGERVGSLAGVPLLVKDLEEAAGLPTSFGSAALGPSELPPAKEDSTHVARLKAAGAIVVGKTNTPELGFAGRTQNRRFGVTRNPWDVTRSPGGSSGGSAAAVAAGMVPLATGSDGGGSIRIPAALCGFSGFKPSLGRVPHGGSEPPSWHDLDSRGPMSRTTRGTALALDAVIGPDPTDLRSLPLPESSWAVAAAEPGLPSRVIWSPTLGYAPVDAEVARVCAAAVSQLESLGVEVEEVESVFGEDPVFAWLSLTNAYNRRSLSGLEGTEAWERVDPDLRALLEFTAHQTVVDLVRAEDECHRLNVRLVELFRRSRLLLCPTTAAPAPLIGEDGLINGEPDPNWVRFTYPFNMTRSPAGTVCAGYTTGGLPVGLQIIGPQHGDLVVLRAMAAIEDALGVMRPAPFPP